MSDYLKKFRSSLPTVQGRQLLRILQEKKDSGEITTVEEFKSRLTSLTAALLAEELTPTLKLFLGKAADLIDSDTYNFMLDRILDDLDAAFAEVATIDEVLSAHNQIVNQVVLKSLQIAINDINDRITLYEFINSNPSGFNKGQFNTFSSTVSQPAPREGQIANVLYQDQTANTANVDTIGERLTLGSFDSLFVPVQSVRQIFDNDVKASEIDVRIEGSDINHIIDGQKGTFWVYNTLLSSSAAAKQGILHKIEVTLAATQDISFVEIEPATPHPMKLVKLAYVNNSGVEIDTGIVSSASPRLLDGPVKINFGRVTAKRVIFHVLQNNYSEVQFEEHETDGVNDALRDVLTSDFQLETLLGVPRNPSLRPTNRMYQFLHGFDNIRIGLAFYDKQSTFVSQALQVDSPGMVGLRVVQTRPLVADASDGSDNYSGSIEYEIVKENFDSQGKLVSIDRFPILPAGVTLIEHERLDLTHAVGGSTKNAGQLIHWPDLATEPKIYRNGTLMLGPSAPIPEWTYEASITFSSPQSKERMVQGVKIVQPKDVDIYTATYTPKTGNTASLPSASILGLPSNLFSVVNLGSASRIRVVTDNVVFTDRELPTATIAKSNIYLIIVLRRNTTDENLTPAVEEYMLLANTEDESKFESDLISE